MELGKLNNDDKCLIKRPLKKRRIQGKRSSGDPIRPNTKAMFSGGSSYSSNEASVIVVEQRTRIIQ